MAIKTLNTIKSWFERADKPTQAQFSDTFDSFRHKNDTIPYSSISGFSWNNLSDKPSFPETKVFEQALTAGTNTVTIPDGGMTDSTYKPFWQNTQSNVRVGDVTIVDKETFTIEAYEATTVNFLIIKIL